ncbi:unnamed protein product [Schistosoma mattheei]|uniref:Uncharacterized protein n=1 Tax=Schistosoma mattheei TaxID=31246 RepID=A0A183PWN0_9TREM|nr:unnamed protein product [Schistosoma mattheei]
MNVLLQRTNSHLPLIRKIYVVIWKDGKSHLVQKAYFSVTHIEMGGK